MKLVFLSNFLNHHQVGLCDELEKMVGIGNFCFIAQEPVPNEKIKLGYLDYNTLRNYVLCEYNNNLKKSKEILNNADCIIVTFSQGVKSIKKLMKNKLILFYQERLFKDYSKLKTFIKFFRAKYYYNRGKENNLFFLNASSYAKQDMNKLYKRKYRNNSYKFGYFPIFDINSQKKVYDSKFRLLFLGRLLDWKHPEIVFKCANILEKKQIDYQIDIVGAGPLYDYIKKTINSNEKYSKIFFHGAVSSEQTNEFYKSNDIFLFSSDRREGWGAVLNEAMYYGCVPLANIEAGATCFLIEDNVNGMIYNNSQMLEDKLLSLYNYKIKGKLNEMSLNAINTITNEWNYSIAAKRLYNVISDLLSHNSIYCYKTGPLSKDE